MSAIALVLLAVDAFAYANHDRLAEDFLDLVYITREGNLPTWYSSTLLLFAGIAAYCVGKEKRLDRDRKKYFAWMIIAGFFVLMAIDDASKLHERISTVLLDPVVNAENPGKISEKIDNFTGYYWHLVFLPFYGSIGLFMFVFLWRELQTPNLRVLYLSALTLWVIAVGLDIFDGTETNYAVIHRHTTLTFDSLQHKVRAFEEYIEIMGAILFLETFLGVKRPAK